MPARRVIVAAALTTPLFLSSCAVPPSVVAQAGKVAVAAGGAESASPTAAGTDAPAPSTAPSQPAAPSAPAPAPSTSTAVPQAPGVLTPGPGGNVPAKSLLDTAAQSMGAAKTWRAMYSRTEEGVRTSISCAVDTRTKGRPRLDIDIDDPAEDKAKLHLVVDGDRLYAQLPEESATYGRMPTTRAGNKVRDVIDACLDPATFFEIAGLTHDPQFEYSGASGTGPDQTHLYSNPGGAGSSRYVSVMLDSKMRLIQASETEAGRTDAALMYFGFDEDQYIFVPSESSVRDLPPTSDGGTGRKG